MTKLILAVLVVLTLVDPFPVSAFGQVWINGTTSWPSAIAYPGDFPALPNNQVTCGGDFDNNRVFVATYTNPFGDEIRYEWQNAGNATHGSRRFLRTFSQHFPTEGLLPQEISGFTCGFFNYQVAPSASGSLDGVTSWEGSTSLFGYKLLQSPSGNPTAVSVSNTRQGKKSTIFNSAIDTASISVSGTFTSKPTELTKTSPDTTEVCKFLMTYDINQWQTSRSYKIGDFLPVEKVDQNSWLNSGGTGSDTLQDWPANNFPTFSHVYDFIAILSQKSANFHACNLFSDMPSGLWNIEPFP